MLEKVRYYTVLPKMAELRWPPAVSDTCERGQPGVLKAVKRMVGAPSGSGNATKYQPRKGAVDYP